MEFSVSSTELLIHLNKAIGPIGNNMTMPILEDFLFELNNDELTITASDLETTIITTMNVNSSDEGVFSCPARMLLEIIKSLNNQPVEFKINDGDYQIHISSAFGDYNMSGHDPEDFPRTKGNADMESLNLSSEILLKGITNTLFAVSSDDMRKNMMGVYFQIDFSKINFVATDAHKLVKYEYKGIDSDVTTSFILPRKPLQLLKNILENEDEVVFEYNKTHALFTIGDTVLSCLMLEGKFPDYKLVIPPNNPYDLRLRRSDLHSSLKRLNIFANRTTNQTIFNLSENSLTLTSQDLDYSNDGTEQLACEYNGTPMMIAFNAKFLMEMVAVFDTEYVIFKLDEANRPGIIVPDTSSENEDLMMLIMPVILQ